MSSAIFLPLDDKAGGERLWVDVVPHGFGTVKIEAAGVSSCLIDIS